MTRSASIIGAMVLALGLAPIAAQAQTGAIRGRVTDEASQQPLPGVTVSFAGKSSVTSTDGRYLISGVSATTDSLRARLLGYAPHAEELAVGSGQTVDVNFSMTAQAVQLAAIVAIGYGQQEAGNIIGATTQVTDSAFNTGAIASPQMLIQDKVAGVEVVDNNEPGGGLSVRIRGASSASASNEPLYVIDGVPLSTGSGGGLSAGRDPLNFLNPNDIKDITILRDAAAAAIYGTNAANGVVLITTKSGSSAHAGTTEVEYSTQASASSVTRLPQMMNAQQFAAAVAQYPKYADSLGTANTNWLDLITHTGWASEHNVSVTANSGPTSYRLSLGYLNQDGIVRGTNLNRLSLGANFSNRLFNDRLVVHANLRGSRENDRFTPGDVLGNAASMAPTQPVLQPGSPTGYWDWNTTNASPSNPLASLALAKDQGTTWRSIGNITGTWHLPWVDGLSANMNLGYDYTKTDRQTFTPNNLLSQRIQGHGYLGLTNNTQANQLLDMYAQYAPSRLFGPGSVDLTGGYSYSQSTGRYEFFQENNLASNFLGTNGVPGVTAGTPQNTLNVIPYKLISFFGRLNYNISDKYIAAATIRRDGSSRFGPNRQWGTFPSVALAWRVSREPFMSGFQNLSDLKLRATWARTGNQAIPDFAYVPTYIYSDGQTQVQFGNQFIPMLRPSAVDQNIHWEQTSSYDLGLDWAWSNNRYSGTIDWYRKNTSDMLFFTSVDPAGNLSNYLLTNVGSMRNTGLELALNARLLTGGEHRLGWTANFTASHNSNEMLAIDPRYNGQKVLTGNISGGVGNQVEVLLPGSPVNSFYVYQQRYGANGKPIYNAAGDTAMYVDQNHDGKINDQDRVPFHDPSPKWILGHSSYLTFGHFDGSFTLRAYLGNYVYNNVASNLGAYQNLTGSGMPANLDQSVITTGFITPQYLSSYYVQSASFLRMDNITIGYSFVLSGQPVRVYGTVQNAFTLTGYKGVDPTAGVNGLDNNMYPRARTLTTGLSVRF